MAKKRIDQLTGKSAILQDDDLILVYDSEESGSEKTKKVAVSDFISIVHTNTDYYISTTGSDVTGDGSSGNPWATIGGAISQIRNKYILPGRSITINVADGTYNSATEISIANFPGSIHIVGNNSTPANVTMNFVTNANGFTVNRMAAFSIQGLKLVGFSEAEWKSGIRNFYGPLNVNNCIIEDFGVGITSSQGGHVSTGGVTCNSCNYGIYADLLGTIYFYQGTISNNTDGARARTGHAVTHGTTYTGNTSNTATANDGVVSVL